MITLFAVVYRLPQTGKVVGDVYEDIGKAFVMQDTIKESHGCDSAIVAFQVSEGKL